MKNGATVAAFEREFAAYVGAKFAIALCNGTATLHTALVALGVKPGDKVAVPPLTMSATTIAVLHAGALPVFCDVDPRTWLITRYEVQDRIAGRSAPWGITVSLYGLHSSEAAQWQIDDAAQTLRPHNNGAYFTSYSFQASKILSLGEGGMLVTNDEALAQRAREFSSLGYRMDARQPRIDPASLKSPTFNRHYSLGYNYRMADAVAAKALGDIKLAWRLDRAICERRDCADLYRYAIIGCEWLTPQHIPDGWSHDMWSFAVATDTPERLLRLLDEVERHGGERPFSCWKITYHEEAFKHIAPPLVCDTCGCSSAARVATDRCPSHKSCPGTIKPANPVAESLQPRIAQFQTNNLASAEQNAKALKKAIEVMS